MHSAARQGRSWIGTSRCSAQVCTQEGDAAPATYTSKRHWGCWQPAESQSFLSARAAGEDQRRLNLTLGSSQGSASPFAPVLHTFQTAAFHSGGLVFAPLPSYTPLGALIPLICTLLAHCCCKPPLIQSPFPLFPLSRATLSLFIFTPTLLQQSLRAPAEKGFLIREERSCPQRSCQATLNSFHLQSGSCSVRRWLCSGAKPAWVCPAAVSQVPITH